MLTNALHGPRYTVSTGVRTESFRMPEFTAWSHGNVDDLVESIVLFESQLGSLLTWIVVTNLPLVFSFAMTGYRLPHGTSLRRVIILSKRNHLGESSELCSLCSVTCSPASCPKDLQKHSHCKDFKS